MADRYRTKKDIVIPAGTEIGAPPTASTRWGSDWEATVGLHTDLAGYLSVDIEEAVDLGIVERVNGWSEKIIRQRQL